jgi:hydroxymethylbilane synthase
LLQTELVVRQLNKDHPHLEFDVIKIKTKGDRDRRTSLSHMSGQGIFVKELEEALRSGQIEMAVHSMKDIPTDIDPEFAIAAVCMRIDARDAFVSKHYNNLDELPPGTNVGTGSERRSAQLKAVRPDIHILPLRGNIDTRIKKLYSGEYEGIIVAAAALHRMGWDNMISDYLSVDSFLPSAGQGAIAIETRADDIDMITLASTVNDEPTGQCVQAERAFLRALGGGCRTPIAALGVIIENTLHLKGMVGDSQGLKILKSESQGPPVKYHDVGNALAEKLISAGAGELLIERDV